MEINKQICKESCYFIQNNQINQFIKSSSVNYLQVENLKSLCKVIPTFPVELKYIQEKDVFQDLELKKSLIWHTNINKHIYHILHMYNNVSVYQAVLNKSKNIVSVQKC